MRMSRIVSARLGWPTTLAPALVRARRAGVGPDDQHGVGREGQRPGAVELVLGLVGDLVLLDLGGDHEQDQREQQPAGDRDRQPQEHPFPGDLAPCGCGRAWGRAGCWDRRTPVRRAGTSAAASDRGCTRARPRGRFIVAAHVSRVRRRRRSRRDEGARGRGRRRPPSAPPCPPRDVRARPVHGRLGRRRGGQRGARGLPGRDRGGRLRHPVPDRSAHRHGGHGGQPADQRLPVRAT